MGFKYDDKCTSNSRFSDYSLNDYQIIKKTKLPHLTKSLIGNHHYGFNFEHAKPVFEKSLIVNLLLGDIPTDPKQAAGREGGHAGFLVHVSKSDLNKLERTLKKFKASKLV